MPSEHDSILEKSKPLILVSQGISSQWGNIIFGSCVVNPRDMPIALLDSLQQLITELDCRCVTKTISCWRRGLQIANVLPQGAEVMRAGWCRNYTFGLKR